MDQDASLSPQQRGEDRRKGQRRDPRWRFDPLFAAILVNHIAPAEAVAATIYPQPKTARRSGRFVNIRA